MRRDGGRGQRLRGYIYVKIYINKYLYIYIYKYFFKMRRDDGREQREKIFNGHCSAYFFHLDAADKIVRDVNAT